ncbi:HTH-type transcriptional regulator AcrR [Streptomyces sp. S4.7]|uniref:TetR family transcriptional regulator n=1 Tax=Streptomyces sp. S4.7 TaxID=2705439 RepID=UPI00139943EB|nr:TetR family transcriptional regulator [Streptomyces sp. S4.7]QHY99932.1 HTH-type transcriptional regulator AcrR [Streptomyces sp. S4.7]
MGRVSKEQARENRRRIVDTASRLFREQGTDGVSVADLMKAAGLTHGGFYKHFDSKEALVDEATACAFEGVDEQLAGRPTADDAATDADPEASRRAFIGHYLSSEHRDDMAGGCPTAGLAVDMARGAAGSAARHTYAEGVRLFAQRMTTDDGDGDDGLVRLSTMVGALILARAVSGDPLSDALLAAARAEVST